MHGKASKHPNNFPTRKVEAEVLHWPFVALELQAGRAGGCNIGVLNLAVIGPHQHCSVHRMPLQAHRQLWLCSPATHPLSACNTRHWHPNEQNPTNWLPTQRAYLHQGAVHLRVQRLQLIKQRPAALQGAITAVPASRIRSIVRHSKPHMFRHRKAARSIGPAGAHSTKVRKKQEAALSPAAG